MPSPKSWILVVVAAALIAVLVAWSERVPSVVEANAPTAEFSAARAWPTLSMLADTIGLRVTGTPGADRALQYLAEQVRAIPGVEAEIQDVTGARSVSSSVLLSYRTKNLLVRIPGSSSEVVLVSSHYDSPTSSVGAVDAGIAVAAMIEMIRNIASAPRLSRTVIFNINGAEEQGLLGAHGFLAHPWMKNVRVFIDLESAGTANKALLFQTGPGHSWLAKRYARSVPHPYGTVLGQDIFQSGAIPSSTDFEIYQTARVPGIDIAFFRNGYAYHTQLDRTWNAAPGSLQHMGANALALTKALASGDAPTADAHRRAVYYDFLGITMFAYDDSTATILAVVAAVFAAVAIMLARRRLPLRAMDVGLGFVIALAGWVVGLALTVAVAMAVSMPGGRPHSWFAHPVVPFVGYSALSIATLVALHAWVRRRRALDATAATAAAWAGTLLFFAAGLLALSFAGVGSGYLLLWWVLGGAVGLVLFTHLRERRLWSLVTLVPAGILTMQAAVLFLEFRSIGGRMPLAVPFDVVMAAIVAFCTLLFALLPIATLHGEGWPRRTALILLVAGLLFVVLGALRFPYSRLRPQRLAISHRESADSATLRVTGFDYVGPRAALRGIESARVVANGSARRGPYAVAAPTAGLAPVTLTLISESGDAARNERTLLLHLGATDAYAQQLSVPGSRFVRWTTADSALTSRGSQQADAIAQFVSAPDTGWTIGVVVRGTEPVMMTSTAIRATTTPAAAALIARLPEWTSSYATAQTRRSHTY
jgi:hypothetical protein